MVEGDYFGLQFSARRGEKYWLNLRNSITSQLPIGYSSPIRLDLRVKFHVAPHILQQEITRRLFFSDVTMTMKDGKLVAPLKDAARFSALAIQAEKGDFNATNNVDQLADCFPRYANSEEFKVTAQAEYARLRSMKQSHARETLLREICSLDSYGLDIFSAKDPEGRAYEVGVGPRGILLKEAATENIVRISLDSVKRLTVDRRDCHLVYSHEDDYMNYETEVIDLTLQTKEIAEVLYRSVTEKVEFFTSETVSDPVKDQFVRDLRGSFVSLFNMNTEVGKKFSFDVRRTQKEVQDQARRTLFKQGEGLAAHAHDTEEEVDNSRAREVQMLRDCMTCKVCMDAALDTVLLPCGHFVLCSSCASVVSMCPHCRTDISQRQRVYWDKPMAMCH